MNGLLHILKTNSFYKSALALFLLLFLILSIGSCALRPNEEDPASASDTPGTEVPPSGFDPQPPEINSDNPTETEESPSPTLPAGPDVPAREAADDSFFEDAAFMGNSLMDGFRMFSGITTCDYYTATSMTVIGATSSKSITLENGSPGTMVEGLTQKPYGKIYILLGINEIGMNVEAFAESYGEMLDTIMAAQPECDIYIMGLTPVSAAKSASGDVFTMDRVRSYNEALYKLAAEKSCYYLDLVAALSDESGYLPAAETTDGVHFSANIYGKWADYVRTHYV